jgi:N-acyl-D-aspartate/D-glutamate deacylase
VAEQRRRDGAHSEEAGILRGLANWERLIIVETFAPENADATGRTVGDVAADRRVRESLIVVLLRFAHTLSGSVGASSGQRFTTDTH